MNKTKAICFAIAIAFTGASQASAGGLLGIIGSNGLIGNQGQIVVGPSVNVGNVLSNNNGNDTLNGVLSGNLNGTLNGVLAGAGILNQNGGGNDCGCKKGQRF